MKEQKTLLQHGNKELPTLDLHIRALAILKATTPVSKDEEKALLAYSLWADNPHATPTIATVLGISQAALYKYIERISHNSELEEKYTHLDNALSQLQEEDETASIKEQNTPHVIFRSQLPYLNTRKPDTEQHDNAVKNLKDQGLSTWEIAQKLELQTHRVQNALQRLRGIGDLPPIGFTQDEYGTVCQKVQKLKEERYDIKTIVKELFFHYDYIVFSEAQLGRICGVTRQRIHTIFKELQKEGFPLPHRVRKPLRPEFTKEQL